MLKTLIGLLTKCDLGQLDTAEQFAVSAARTYGENHHHPGLTAF
ncbi:MAG: hypothetical protein ACRDRW_04845 [Pseudonocardiaceae bacterium]